MASADTAATTLGAQDHALTTGAGLLDRSERGRLALTGAQSREFLNGQVTCDVEALEAGEGSYAAFLTHKGKMLGDLRILAADDDELLLDTERVALQALFDLLRRTTIGWETELHKRTLQTAQLSIIGPRARAVTGSDDLPEREHAHCSGLIGGVGVRFVVTDLGVDVLCPADDGPSVTAALVAAGAVPVDEAAAEVLRVESGRPRFGVDLAEGAVIPQEAGLNERAVSFTKGCYVGQETVARLHWRGKPNRHLRGVVLPTAAPVGTTLHLGEREVGRLTSVVDSPRHGPIALALVRREVEPGDDVVVGDGPAVARVVALPFA